MMSNKNKKEEYWYPEDVRPYIIKYLKDRFPDSIIRQESNFIDIMVLRSIDSVPVEIQKTYIRSDVPLLKRFENDIRNQVEQNVDISGKCWLFLDAKFLEYLKNTFSKYISLNMKWLYLYYKEEKVKIFSITREGLIKELKEEDMVILTKFGISELDRNRANIEYNILKWKMFSTDEINSLYKKYKENRSESIKFDQWLTREDSSDREKEYGYICQTLGQLNYINDALSCELSRNEKVTIFLRRTGLIHRNGGGTNDKFARITFVDNPNIAQYFSGYIKNKELWDYLRVHPVDTRTFHTIVRGEYPNFIKDRKNQKSIDNAWG